MQYHRSEMAGGILYVNKMVLRLQWLPDLPLTGRSIYDRLFLFGFAGEWCRKPSG